MARPKVETPPRRFFTTTEAAAYCGYTCRESIRKAVRQGKLHPAGKRGRSMMFTIADLDRFLQGLPPPQKKEKTM